MVPGTVVCANVHRIISCILRSPGCSIHARDAPGKRIRDSIHCCPDLLLSSPDWRVSRPTREPNHSKLGKMIRTVSCEISKERGVQFAIWQICIVVSSFGLPNAKKSKHF
jgi:hypothetical protein